MKIIASDKQAENVDAVFLDGKRLVTCIEADDEAGYVIVLVPPPSAVKDDADFNDKNKVTIALEDPFDAATWTKKRLEGEVEIVFKLHEGLEDSGLEQ